jgi:hypothetical protein
MTAIATDPRTTPLEVHPDPEHTAGRRLRHLDQLFKWYGFIVVFPFVGLVFLFVLIIMPIGLLLMFLGGPLVYWGQSILEKRLQRHREACHAAGLCWRCGYRSPPNSGCPNHTVEAMRSATSTAE